MDQVKPGMYPVIIYDEIRNNTSSNKKTTLKELTKLLCEYNRDVNQDSMRKTVERLLPGILEYDTNIKYINKKNKSYSYGDKSASAIEYLYYEREIEKTDVQIISDALLYSKHLDLKTRNVLIKKLEKMIPGNIIHWASKAISDSEALAYPVTNELYNNLELINDAIVEKRCISFDTNVFTYNKKFKKGTSHSGFSPYFIYQKDGSYYLVGVPSSERKRIDNWLKNHPNDKLQYTIQQIEIFRLSNIRFDDDSPYLPIENTQLEKASIKTLINSDFNPWTNRLNKNHPYAANEVNLLVSDHGLHIIMSEFYKKAYSSKALNSTRTIAGHKTDVPQVKYTVKLEKLNSSQWQKLVYILANNSVYDIKLLDNHQKLNNTINNLKKQLLDYK